jgi:phospholipid/cholesterol/gamma-HCH transport system substrate-binding protein
MSSRSRNVITGIVVLGSMFVFIWMVLKFTGRAAGAFAPKGVPIVVVATRGDGLAEGSAVAYRGVTVGKVTSISRSADNLHVRIGAEIEASPPLPRDLTALIRTQSMLGTGSVIELQVTGEPTGTLMANQEIPATYVGMQFLPPEFSDILTDVRRQKLIEHTDQVMTNVRDLVGDPKVQSDIRTAIANLNTASERANVIAVNFEKFSADLQKVSTNANETIGQLRQTVAHTGSDVDDLTRSLIEDTGKVGKVLDQFQQVSAKINNGKGTAGKLVNDPALYDELTDTARELNLVAKSMKRLVDQWEQEGLSLKVK